MAANPEEHASLREDYLNQVQRDFLSRCLLQGRNTPSECVHVNTAAILAARCRDNDCR